ncbi:defense protein 3, partial [Biomphalaria pfeifferi]
ITMARILVTVYVLIAATLCSGFPAGGPYYSCKGLLPAHNGDAKTTTPPYAMSVSRATVEPGGSTSVTLYSKGDMPFMGFMCAASENDDQANNTVGEFSMTAASLGLTQLLNCSRSTPDTGITHVNNDPKTKIGFDWTVPAYAAIGSVFKIRCTFVQSFNAFWQNVLVRITVVGGDQNVSAEASPMPVASVSVSSTTRQDGTGSSSPTQTDSQADGNLTTQSSPDTTEGEITEVFTDFNVSAQEPHTNATGFIDGLLNQLKQIVDGFFTTDRPAGLGIDVTRPDNNIQSTDSSQQRRVRPNTIHFNMDTNLDVRVTPEAQTRSPMWPGFPQNNWINELLQNANVRAFFSSSSDPRNLTIDTRQLRRNETS